MRYTRRARERHVVLRSCPVSLAGEELLRVRVPASVSRSSWEKNLTELGGRWLAAMYCACPSALKVIRWRHTSGVGKVEVLAVVAEPVFDGYLPVFEVGGPTRWDDHRRAVGLAGVGFMDG